MQPTDHPIRPKLTYVKGERQRQNTAHAQGLSHKVASVSPEGKQERGDAELWERLSPGLPRMYHRQGRPKERQCGKISQGKGPGLGALAFSYPDRTRQDVAHCCWTHWPGLLQVVTVCIRAGDIKLLQNEQTKCIQRKRALQGKQIMEDFDFKNQTVCELGTAQGRGSTRESSHREQELSVSFPSDSDYSRYQFNVSVHENLFLLRNSILCSKVMSFFSY